MSSDASPGCRPHHVATCVCARCGSLLCDACSAPTLLPNHHHCRFGCPTGAKRLDLRLAKLDIDIRALRVDLVKSVGGLTVLADLIEIQRDLESSSV